MKWNYLSKLFLKTGQRHFLKFNNKIPDMNQKKKSIAYYVLGSCIAMIGFTYAGVPIYRKFCQRTGIGGNTEFAKVLNDNLIKSMKPIRDRVITVEFGCDKTLDMCWEFYPLQKQIKVIPGETALAFYRASNPTNRPITGIATYNILPVEAGKYFHKIQCFCFEEQRLNSKEEVDMPVFFFLDPEFDNDYKLMYTDNILLTYTFFEAKESLNLPLPEFLSSK